MKKPINTILPLIIISLVGLFLFKYFKQKEKIVSIISTPSKKSQDPPSNIIDNRNKKWATDEERKLLCEKLGIIYSRTLVFSNECIHLSKIDPLYLQLDGNIKKPDQKRADYLKKCVSSEYQSPTYIKWVNDTVGYGLFANADISKDEFIMEYAGMVVEQTKDSTYSWAYPCIPGGFGFDKKRYIIDAKILGGEARFVNDPINPNFVNLKLGLLYNNGSYHMIYIAAKDIKEGDQLFISYGDDYWKNRRQ